MPKFEFVKNKDGEISVDKLSFDHSNKAQKEASDWLLKDLDIKEIVITQIEPKDQYRLIIDRIGIIKTHFELNGEQHDSSTSKIGNNHRIKDKKKTNILNKGGYKSNNNGTNHKK